jgi:hypothetical protein
MLSYVNPIKCVCPAGTLYKDIRIVTAWKVCV